MDLCIAKCQKYISQFSSTPGDICVAGHSENCECDVCSSQFPLRTHLMLDMNLHAAARNASGGGGGSGVKFSLFGRYRKPLLSKEDRRSSTARVSATFENTSTCVFLLHGVEK